MALFGFTFTIKGVEYNIETNVYKLGLYLQTVINGKDILLFRIDYKKVRYYRPMIKTDIESFSINGEDKPIDELLIFHDYKVGKMLPIGLLRCGICKIYLDETTEKDSEKVKRFFCRVPVSRLWKWKLDIFRLCKKCSE